MNPTVKNDVFRKNLAVKDLTQYHNFYDHLSNCALYYNLSQGLQGVVQFSVLPVSVHFPEPH